MQQQQQKTKQTTTNSCTGGLSSIISSIRYCTSKENSTCTDDSDGFFLCHKCNQKNQKKTNKQTTTNGCTGGLSSIISSIRYCTSKENSTCKDDSDGFLCHKCKKIKKQTNKQQQTAAQVGCLPSSAPSGIVQVRKTAPAQMTVTVFYAINATKKTKKNNQTTTNSCTGGLSSIISSIRYCTSKKNSTCTDCSDGLLNLSAPLTR